MRVIIQYMLNNRSRPNGSKTRRWKMPGILDLALVALFAVVWPLLEYFWVWPRHVQRVDRGDPDARTSAYARTIVEQWVLAALVMALTVAFRRPLAGLGLRGLDGWRLWLGVGLP